MEHSKFQFTGFKIIKSLIEINTEEQLDSRKITIGFEPNGLINEKENTFHLHIDTKIKDENNSFNIEISALATYVFKNEINKDSLGSYFYINAPALLFPYIRAYISTLTNLSGFQPINLPTLNMTRLGKDLEKNTKTAP